MPAAWSHDHPAVWKDVVAGGRAITVRHPTYPFPGTWRAGDRGGLIRIAAAYLEAIRPALGLPPLFDRGSWEFRDTVPLTWLPLAPPGRRGSAVGGPTPPRESWWAHRYAGLPGRPQLVDRIAILLAVQTLDLFGARLVLGSRLGIRIVAHVSASPAPPWPVRITGAACARGLADVLRAPPDPRAATALLQRLLGEDLRRDVLVERLASRLARAAGEAGADVRVDGLALVRVPHPGLVIYGYSPRSAPPDSVAHALTALISEHAEEVERFPLVSRAGAVRQRLFHRDPASEAGPAGLVGARPTRAPAALEPFRHPVDLPGLTLAGGETVLLDDLDQVKVTRSKLVDPTADENDPERVRPGQVRHPRTNPFAALSGYQQARGWRGSRHARGLLDTLRACGLPPEQYFRFAGLPLLVRYRAAMTRGPGRDGRTVNAEVHYDPPDADLLNPDWDPTVLRQLQTRFALADGRRSASRREPLGLAVDPRWSWHEYGHVLLAAATGALELRFAHSVGDALAAVLNDPGSELAPPDPAVPVPGLTPARRAGWERLRLLTFPWVYLNRSHGRSVFLGWSWSGRYHRPTWFPADGSNHRRKGYLSEQILSTTLFRLYRALGGDTVRPTGRPDRAARQAAADYTAYLIIRAIQLLGAAFLLPAETPDQLVSALTDADIATRPVTTGPLRGRVGGCAHKVIRWAFEAQGLYASPDPRAVVDAPGRPPDVDVFIDDGRPDAEGAFPRGGYMPVSLAWPPAAGAPPRWHATAQAVRVAGNRVWVKVRNRGGQAATGVRVRVLYARWRPGTAAPKWNGPQWQPLGTSGPRRVPAWPGEVTFGPIAGLPAHRPLLVVAEATGEADRANSDPATGLPCATLPTPVVDLVAGDNNLGLRLLDAP